MGRKCKDGWKRHQFCTDLRDYHIETRVIDGKEYQVKVYKQGMADGIGEQHLTLQKHAGYYEE